MRKKTQALKRCLMIKKNSKLENELTEAERQRIALIKTIQELWFSHASITTISSIVKKDWRTVKKYITGNPEELCHNKSPMRQSRLDCYTNEIITFIKLGMTQSSIARELIRKGYTGTETNARMYICLIAQKYGLTLSKYGQNPGKYSKDGNMMSEFDCVTRKAIFNHLWMDEKLAKNRYYLIWEKYPILQVLEKCIRQFREIFDKKIMNLLYIFIDRYKRSSMKELSSFANGLKHDLSAVENAVASPLSNGFVEGINNKIKEVKRTMYGRCRKELLAAKLMLRI